MIENFSFPFSFSITEREKNMWNEIKWKYIFEFKWLQKLLSRLNTHKFFFFASAFLFFFHSVILITAIVFPLFFLLNDFNNHTDNRIIIVDTDTDHRFCCILPFPTKKKPKEKVVILLQTLIPPPRSQKPQTTNKLFHTKFDEQIWLYLPFSWIVVFGVAAIKVSVSCRRWLPLIFCLFMLYLRFFFVPHFILHVDACICGFF